MADEEAAVSPKKSGGKPDLATIGGLVVALVCIIGGLLMEGGKIKDVAQVTAAMIVIGGTAGAVMVSTPMAILIGAVRRLNEVVLDAGTSHHELIEEMIGYATRARKQGLVSLEHAAAEIADPFLRKALNLAVDGADLQEIRKMLELEIAMVEHQTESEAKVFENAGGYAPTIGIIGAVLGLIQVMKNLANIEEVGHGIAVAFVATVYGVGSANLVLLPAATKIKTRAREESHRRELILEGVCGIVEGLNPKLIRIKLEAYVAGQTPPKRAEEALGREAAKSPAEAKA
jgi:chemotaxis protein MotA